MELKITRIVSLILVGCTLLLPFPSYAQPTPKAEEPLVIGILPFRSPVALLKRFSPLRNYLQEKIGQDIIMETASNYDEFVMRTHSRRYDFVLTAPHFTLQALDSGRYELAATYLKPLTAAISVRRDSNIRYLNQLDGKKISVPPETAIITIAGKSFLKQYLKSTPSYQTYQTHNASLDAMVVGNTTAAIASLNPTRQYIQRDVPIRIIATTPELPGMGLLVAKDLDRKIKNNYKDALIKMNKDTHGKQALKKMGYSGYRSATKQEFESTRRFLDK